MIINVIKNIRTVLFDEPPDARKPMRDQAEQDHEGDNAQCVRGGHHIELAEDTEKTQQAR